MFVYILNYLCAKVYKKKFKLFTFWANFVKYPMFDKECYGLQQGFVNASVSWISTAGICVSNMVSSCLGRVLHIRYSVQQSSRRCSQSNVEKPRGSNERTNWTGTDFIHFTGKIFERFSLKITLTRTEFCDFSIQNNQLTSQIVFTDVLTCTGKGTANHRHSHTCALENPNETNESQ